MYKPSQISQDFSKPSNKQSPLISQNNLNEIKYAFKSNSLNTFRKSKGHVAKLDDPTQPSITQSRTFKLLQETLDNGLKEKEAVFYDNITNKNQTRRCSLDANSMKKNNSVSPLKIKTKINEQKELECSSLSSSSENKSDNEENNSKMGQNSRKRYVNRSNSLAASHVLLPTSYSINSNDSDGINNHEKYFNKINTHLVNLDESDSVDDYSSSLTNVEDTSNFLKMSNKLL